MTQTRKSIRASNVRFDGQEMVVYLNINLSARKMDRIGLCTNIDYDFEKRKWTDKIVFENSNFIKKWKNKMRFSNFRATLQSGYQIEISSKFDQVWNSKENVSPKQPYQPEFAVL